MQIGTELTGKLLTKIKDTCLPEKVYKMLSPRVAENGSSSGWPNDCIGAKW